MGTRKRRMIGACAGGLMTVAALLWLITVRPSGAWHYAAATLLVTGALLAVVALWGPGRAERVLAVAATVAGIIAAIVAIPTDRGHSNGEKWCAGAPAGKHRITGTTSARGANIRAQPRLDAPTPNGRQRRFDARCRVGFTGYCIGDRVFDHFIGKPDQRWYILPKGAGVVASAVILEHGVPTIGMAPQPCPGALPTPAGIAVTPKATKNPRTLAVRIKAPDAVIVGLLARPQRGEWQHIGWDAKYANGFTVKGSLPAPWHRRGELLAVVCYALERPSQVMARYSVRVSGGDTELRKVALSGGGIDLRRLSFAACRPSR